jgi:hypothetical protein
MEHNQLDRYTNLPFLIDILVRKKLTLTDPSFWEDKNDSLFIQAFKVKSNYKTVLAMCFAAKSQTFHHWKVFTKESNGVCIRFNKDKLIPELKSNQKSLLTGKVKYRTIATLRKNPPETIELPFLKRKAFLDECEYRIIYFDETNAIVCKQIDFSIKCIDAIIFNPWLPNFVEESITKTIRDIEGCQDVKIVKSDLFDNDSWKMLAIT